jgi:hypothetical protein
VVAGRSRFLAVCFEEGCFVEFNGLRPSEAEMAAVQGIIPALGDPPAHKRAVLKFARTNAHLLRWGTGSGFRPIAAPQ